jgi:hypothetical protein
MRRLAPLLTLVLVLLAAPAAQARHKSCASVRGTKVVLRDAKALVLTRTIEEGLGESFQVYGCLRSRRRPVLVNAVGFDQYSTSTITAIGLNGTFVATSSSGGVIDGSCYAHMLVYSLVRRRAKHSYRIDGNESDGCPGIDTFVMGARGRAAFMEGGSRLHKFDATGEHQIDEGDIDPDSLDIVGNLVHWTNAGEARSHPLF